MKKVLPILLLSLLICGILVAQGYKGKGRVQGIVTDMQGNPVEGVRVKLFSVRAESGLTVTTDKDGIWKATWLRGGPWNADYEKLGYAPKSISFRVSEYQRNPLIDVKLEKVEGLIVSEGLEDELNKGNALFDEGKYDEARAAYEKILAENPDAYIVNTNIGNCYFQQEEYDLAIEKYNLVLEQAPDDYNTFLNIGNAMANKGENELALEWYNKVEFEKIDNVTVLYNIGTNYYNLGKYNEALKFYQRSVELQDDYLDGIYQLGLVHLNLGNKDLSIASFEKYLEKDDESGRADQVRGFLDYLKK